jgi:hypothetical protein
VRQDHAAATQQLEREHAAALDSRAREIDTLQLETDALRDDLAQCT